MSSEKTLHYNPPSGASILSRLRQVAGFTLVEVVLSLAVIAVAMVGLMGLFPVALKMADDSMMDTRASFIAQRVFAELDLQTENTRNLNLGEPSNLPITLSTDDDLAFFCDDEGTRLAVSVDNFATPPSLMGDGDGPVVVVRVRSNPLNSLENLAVVSVDVDAPALAMEENRRRETFSRLFKTLP